MTIGILKKYIGVILSSIVLLPIYHIPVFMLTIMFVTGVTQEQGGSLFLQGIILLIGIGIEIVVHSLPNIFMYIIFSKKNKKEENKKKFKLGEYIIIAIVVISYLVMFIAPLM